MCLSDSLFRRRGLITEPNKIRKSDEVYVTKQGWKIATIPGICSRQIKSKKVNSLSKKSLIRFPRCFQSMSLKLLFAVGREEVCNKQLLPSEQPYNAVCVFNSWQYFIAVWFKAVVITRLSSFPVLQEGGEKQKEEKTLLYKCARVHVCMWSFRLRKCFIIWILGSSHHFPTCPIALGFHCCPYQCFWYFPVKSNIFAIFFATYLFIFYFPLFLFLSLLMFYLLLSPPLSEWLC